MTTRKEIRKALDALPNWRKPVAYLISSEHYDVSADGETKSSWVRDAVEYAEPYLVSINTGGYTGVTVAVVAGHPDEALETADEWACTKYYDSDHDECEEARGRGEGVVSVQHLMEARESNPSTSESELTKRLKF